MSDSQMNPASDRQPEIEPENEAAIREELAERIEAGSTPVEWIFDIVLDSVEETRCSDDELRGFAERTLVEMSAERWREEKDWPETDNDRLDRAFAELERQGIIARQDWTCCCSCGWAEMEREIATAREEGRDVIGCVFYHDQDADRVRGSGELAFAFGSVDDDTEKDCGIGRRLVDALRSAGFRVEWDEHEWLRVIVTGFNWQRRWRMEFAFAEWLGDEKDEEEYLKRIRARYKRLRNMLDQCYPEWRQSNVIAPPNPLLNL